jgi:hypothetical protein
MNSAIAPLLCLATASRASMYARVSPEKLQRGPGPWSAFRTWLALREGVSNSTLTQS